MELTAPERNRLANTLMARLNATPGQLFCPLLYALGDGYHLDPDRMEKFLAHRGHLPQTISTDDGDETIESLKDMLQRIYGTDTAELAEKIF